MTYNSKREILGAISTSEEIAYHLWKIEYSRQNSNDSVKLLKKGKWHSQYDIGDSEKRQIFRS